VIHCFAAQAIRASMPAARSSITSISTATRWIAALLALFSLLICGPAFAESVSCQQFNADWSAGRHYLPREGENFFYEQFADGERVNYSARTENSDADERSGSSYPAGCQAASDIETILDLGPSGRRIGALEACAAGSAR
jgi:hypothetical protein